ARAEDAAERVSRRVASLLATLKSSTQVGVCAVDLRTGATWAASDENLPLKPASVLKLFTTAAALVRFGPDFQYETQLYSNGNELLLRGGGDPGLGDERIAKLHNAPIDAALRAWIEAARRASGGRAWQKIVIDDSVFDEENRNPLWPEDQHMAWYQAPIGGLNYNDNCVDARAEIRDGSVLVTLRPPLPPAFVQNTMRPGKTHRPVVRRDAGSDIFEFTGSLAHGGELEPIAVNRPSVVIGQALRQALESNGLGGDVAVVRRVLSPADLQSAQLLDTQRTPLREAVWRANTFSQNMFAECMLKSLAAYRPDGRRSGTPGSWPGGVQVLRETLGGVGVDLKGANIVDGCGLAHENRVTARQIVALLQAMNRHSAGGVYRDSLADAGQEGTLKNRYKDAAFAGKLRAKTGTIQNVHTLAGYLTRDDQATLAFAILTNGPNGADLPQRIVRALLE
ncbi:MAG: D-alanyl-D-alanine carboxypeptidase/D-alanyl-D-alanine-endopeptidase, partial [Planctomycetes bacterium]|nr:D-alanyl-D-alanine carboxypeptidase/D-alanyl-D-alanine-endopeptidase [Planctomycetota bacterium]